MRLQGKLAIVTAAASGMGRAGVERFVREGAQVAAVDINPEALDALAAEFGHDRVHVITADLATDDGALSSIDQAVAALGGADILWAHAGMPGPASVEELDMAAYRQAIDLNITSAALGAGRVAAAMRARGGGSIIFTSSIRPTRISTM
jgi:NAD(P)-dependent dehydrogenase (short-subunit alcohol dehydrogenase family)